MDDWNELTGPETADPEGDLELMIDILIEHYGLRAEPIREEMPDADRPH